MKQIACLLLGCLLLSCQTQPLEPLPEPLDLSWINNVENWRGEEQRMTQLATFEDHHNAQIHTVRFDVELSRSALVMIAQTTMGVPLYESTFSAGTLDVRRHLNEQFPVEPVVADFLLANWPVEGLMPALSAIGYTLVQNENGRSLEDITGALLVEMRRYASDEQTLQITHHDIPLTIHIRTLERQPLR